MRRELRHERAGQLRRRQPRLGEERVEERAPAVGIVPGECLRSGRRRGRGRGRGRRRDADADASDREVDVDAAAFFELDGYPKSRLNIARGCAPPCGSAPASALTITGNVRFRRAWHNAVRLHFPLRAHARRWRRCELLCLAPRAPPRRLPLWRARVPSRRARADPRARAPFPGPFAPPPPTAPRA